MRKQPSFKWAQYKAARSPTKPETNVMQTESPHPSPQKSEYDTTSRHTATTSYQSTYTDPSRTSRSTAATSIASVATPDTSTMSAMPNRPQAIRQDSNLTTNISTSSEKRESTGELTSPDNANTGPYSSASSCSRFPALSASAVLPKLIGILLLSF